MSDFEREERGQEREMKTRAANIIDKIMIEVYGAIECEAAEEVHRILNEILMGKDTQLAVLAERDALAAQILALADALEDAEAPDAEAGDMWDASQCADWIREQSPTTTLTKRDLIKQAEALEEAADQLPNSHPVAIGLRNQAAELRRQAEGGE